MPVDTRILSAMADLGYLGLKAAQEEVQTAKASAERLALKAIRKANTLGIKHTLSTGEEVVAMECSCWGSKGAMRLDLELDGSHSGASAMAEESIEQKLQAIQSQQDQSRQEIRELDKRKMEVGLDTEKEANDIGDAMETLIQQLESIKGWDVILQLLSNRRNNDWLGKLPPDRSNEVTSVEEVHFESMSGHSTGMMMQGCQCGSDTIEKDTKKAKAVAKGRGHYGQLDRFVVECLLA